MEHDNGLAWAESMRDRQESPELPEPKLHCRWCGKPIYEGEPVYSIAGIDLCEECVFDIYGRYA